MYTLPDCANSAGFGVIRMTDCVRVAAVVI